jgi:MFS family permease
VVAVLAYIRHARRAADPILDLKLFRSRAFTAAVAGGSLFRIGTGAVPFLLPLMFQLIFGLSPFQSGLLTFVSAIGALSMKFLAPSALRAAGFRTITVASAVGGGMLIAAMALFTAETPYPAIIATLLAGGFLRSLFFTSANVLAFADIDDKQAGQATAISAAAMQISIALGVACAGGLLEIVTMFSDGVLERSAFAVAFIAAGAIAVISAILYARLPRDVGAAISGHRSKAEERPELQE